LSGLPFDEFLLVFAVIFGLELVDRTSFAVMALSTRQPQFPTWAGAALGFTCVSAIGVTIGAELTDFLGPSHIAWLRIGGGAFLVAYALFVYFEGEKEEASVERVPRAPWVTAFLVIFLLELGDTTMIFEVVFVGTTGNPILVFIAGTLALVSVAAIASTIGSYLGTRLDREFLKKLVVVILIVVGIATILYGLDPQLYAPLGSVLLP
jgi:Ca2+/H+ antiporter, TMEM165/GDT1 family